MSSQKADLIDFLQQRGSITRLEAVLELGIVELPARVCELTAEGFEIPRERVEVRARNGRVAKVTRYFRPTKWP